MQDGEKLSLEEIRALLEASEEVHFQGKRRQEVYQWITLLLRQQSYRTQGKVVRGLLRRYVAKMTGRSRAQVTRLIGRYMEHSEVKESNHRHHRFQSRFTQADLELLANVDEAHETMSGPATKKILEREWKLYRHAEYQRLATISVAHIYNLRKRRRYRECRMDYTKTRAVQVAIGERRKPQPGGQPGYLRVDTVHQGETRTESRACIAHFTGDSEPVSISHSRFSFRQRLGVHQRIGVGLAATIVDRAD